MRRNQWTEEEDARLIQLVSNNAGNLNAAFRLYAGENPRRSFVAIRLRWYRILQHKNTCFITIDKKHSYANRKIAYLSNVGYRIKVSIWKKICKLILG